MWDDIGRPGLTFSKLEEATGTKLLASTDTEAGLVGETAALGGEENIGSEPSKMFV